MRLPLINEGPRAVLGTPYEAAVKSNTSQRFAPTVSPTSASAPVAEQSAVVRTNTRIVTRGQASGGTRQEFADWSEDAHHSSLGNGGQWDGDEQDDDWQKMLNRVRSLKHAAEDLLKSGELDLSELSELLHRVKQGQPELQALQREDDPLLHSFAGSMVNVLKRFAVSLDKAEPIPTRLTVNGEFVYTNACLSGLDADGVRTICNGLATLYGSDARHCLFDSKQLSRVTEPLRRIHDALIIQAMHDGLPAELPSNGCLLDILNAQSRGLKAGVLRSDRPLVRELSARALDVIEGWPSATDGPPVTEAGKVVSRQLSKTLLQLNMMVAYDLLPLDSASEEGRANRQRLRALTNKLCCDAALGELCLWRDPKDAKAPARRVAPQCVEVTNISNTLKDFLENGILFLSDAETATRLQAVTALMLQIPEEQLTVRSGQGLANCSNFLRTIHEHSGRQSGSNPVAGSAPYLAACTKLLQIGANHDHWQQIATLDAHVQTLANLTSFVKAMNKVQGIEKALLQNCAAELVRQLSQFGVSKVEHPVSASSLMAGLVYFGDLVPMATVKTLIESLAVAMKAQECDRWPAKSRAQALRGLLIAQQQWDADPAAVRGALSKLLDGGPALDDPLSCLKAVRWLATTDATVLSAYSKLLLQLMPDHRSGAVSLKAIDAAIEGLERLDTQAPPPPPSSFTAIDQATKPKQTETKPPMERVIPGLTQLAQPSPPAFQENKRDSRAKTTTTLSVSATGIVQNPTEPPRSVDDGWAKPKKSARRVPATQPVIVKRDAENDARSRLQTKPKEELTVSTRAQAPASRQMHSAKSKTISKPGTSSVSSSTAAIPVPTPSTPLSQAKPVSEDDLLSTLARGDRKALSRLMADLPAQSFENAISLLDRLFANVAAAQEDHVKALSDYLSRLKRKVIDRVLDEIDKRNLKVAESYRVLLWTYRHATEPIRMTKSGSRATSVSGPSPISTPSRLSTSVFPLHSPVSEGTASPIRQFSGIFAPVLEQIEESGSTNPMIAHAMKGNISALNMLLKSPKNKKFLTQRDPETDHNPLSIAIMTGQSAVIDLILSTPVGRSSARSRFGIGAANVLHVAAMSGNTHAMAALLEKIEDPEKLALEQGPYVPTPLIIAASSGHIDIMRLLLALPNGEAQAIQPSESAEGCALNYAVLHGKFSAVKLLLSLQNASEQIVIPGIMGLNAISTAVSVHDPETLALLLETPGASAAVFASVVGGGNVLGFAILSEDKRCAEQLLNSAYLSPLSVSVQTRACNPLLAAISAGYTEACQTLLSLDTAVVQAAHIGPKGENALIAATSKHMTDVVRQLLDLPNAAQQAAVRADPIPPVEQGDQGNARLLAISLGETVILNDSTQHGTGKNAYQIAQETGAEDIAELLRRFEPTT